MQNFQNPFETRKRSFISAFSICMTVPLNDDIVHIDKPDGICSPTFVVNECSGRFLHPSIFSIKHLKSG